MWTLLFLRSAFTCPALDFAFHGLLNEVERLVDFVLKLLGCLASWQFDFDTGQIASGAELGVAGDFLRVGCVELEHGDSPWVRVG